MNLAEQRMLVTGGAGFLGSVVVRKLRERGCKLVFVPRSREYDLRDRNAIVRLFRETRPNVVIHLAAVVGGIGANLNSPGRFFYDNALMGIQLMEYARLADVRKFVAVGTVCSYPKIMLRPFEESHIWEGYPEETNAPYGLAKKMLLVQAQAYREQYGFNAIYLIPTNLYGPGDNFDAETSHVIPAIIRKCVEAKRHDQPEVELWGSGKPTREFLYVDDAAEGIVRATEHYDDGFPVNLGTGKEETISVLAWMIARETGFEGKFVWNAGKPDGQPRRRLDVRMAKALFGFEAQVTLKQGLKWTVEWYLSKQ